MSEKKINFDSRLHYVHPDGSVRQAAGYSYQPKPITVMGEGYAHEETMRHYNFILSQLEKIAKEIAVDWDAGGKIHNWRNYVTGRMRTLWTTFTTEQQAAIMENAQAQADREEWE